MSYLRILHTQLIRLSAYESLRTVGSLLLTNSDFRLFLGDLGTIGRQVFADTAFSLSAGAEEVAKKLEPSEEQSKKVQKPGADDGPPPGAEDLEHEVKDVSKVVANGLVKTGKDAVTSLQENVSGEQKDTLIHRLQQLLQNYASAMTTRILSLPSVS